MRFLLFSKPKVLVFALALAVCCLGCRSEESELTEARAWSVLQGVEVSNRGNSDLPTPFVIHNAIDSGYDAAGLRSLEKDVPYVWVLLNQGEGAHTVKVMPEKTGFLVSCSEVEELNRTERVSREVHRFLQQNCVESSQ